MKIKVLRDFRDKTADLKLRKKDEILEVDKERAAILSGLGFAEAYKEIQKEAAK